MPVAAGPAYPAGGFFVAFPVFDAEADGAGSVAPGSNGTSGCAALDADDAEISGEGAEAATDAWPGSPCAEVSFDPPAHSTAAMIIVPVTATAAATLATTTPLSLRGAATRSGAVGISRAAATGADVDGIGPATGAGASIANTGEVLGGSDRIGSSRAAADNR